MNPPPKWWQKGSFFLVELVILVLGIMISFMLNEWRLSVKEAKDRVFVLEQFRRDLAADTAVLRQEIRQLEKVDEYCALILRESPKMPVDSQGHLIGSILNITGPTLSQSAYLEVLQTGRQQVVNNDSLLTRLLHIYNQLYPNIGAWTMVDQKLVLDQLFPFVHEHFPHASRMHFDELGPDGKARAREVFQSDHFRNLVQSTGIIKKNVNTVFKTILTYLEETLELLETELTHPK